VSGPDYPGGPIDVQTLEVLGQRGRTHSLVDGWVLQPDRLSPRRLELSLDDSQYPLPVADARLDVRWFEGGDYTVHYLERRDGGVWQCRWDRHPKPGEPREHFHPPPDADDSVEPTALEATDHLGVLFGVLDWISDRVESLHDG